MTSETPNTERSLPVTFVPTPTVEYRKHRKLTRAGVGPAAPPVPSPIPIPIPLFVGARVLMWKQDPSVAEIGVRKAYLPRRVLAGPKDTRITTTVAGMPPVTPNAMGDLIQAPGTPAFDAVHTFAVVRESLTLIQRALAAGGVPAPVPWQWNGPTNTDPLQVFPHHSNMMNAFYSRTGKMLAFGFFPKPGPPPNPMIFTCRSLDIVSHETGHAILDGLKPGWLAPGNPPQTGGLHEALGDLTAVFLALSQLDQVEAIIAQTKANLHDKTFLSDLAEEFGLALGRTNGLRNADNDFKLSQVGNEVHSLSQVFTGGIYDVLADIFAFERRPAVKDDAAVLYEVGQYVWSLLLRAIVAAPAAGATYANVVNQMLTIANADGKPVAYQNFIRNRFVFREVVVSLTPLTEDHREAELAAGVADAPGIAQDRRGCCGTMTLAENSGADEATEAELDEFRRSLQAEIERRVGAAKAKR